MLNANEAREAANAVILGTTGRERRAYQAKHNAIADDFFEYLANEYASNLSPSIVSKIRYRASEAATTSAFSDTEHHYSIFAEFAQEVVIDAKK